MKTAQKLLTFICACILLCACCEKVDGLEDEVIDILDGNTLELSSGLRVHLCGIDPDNQFCKEYLKENVLGSTVRLSSDGADVQEISSYDEEINAYVYLMDEAIDLNRQLLTIAGHDAYLPLNICDSTESYQAIFDDNDPYLNSVALAAKMKASSVLICSGDKQSTWIGTGFFINRYGLALTNNHVLKNRNGYVYLSDSQGNLSKNPYPVKNIVYTDEDLDFTIFHVDIDREITRNLSYLKLTTENIQSGKEVAAIGNPAPGNSILTMSYAEGTVAAIRRNEGKIQINVPITHGFSGGPVCNRKGHIIGISQSGFGTADLNFAIDIYRVREQLNANNLQYAGK